MFIDVTMHMRESMMPSTLSTMSMSMTVTVCTFPVVVTVIVSGENRWDRSIVVFPIMLMWFPIIRMGGIPGVSHGWSSKN